jgi:pilus assembly protein CpaE
MNVFLISEDETLARSIRQIMMRERVYCPLSSMISFDQAVRRLSNVVVDMLVAVLPEDPIQCVEALELLSVIPRTERSTVIAVGPAADAKMVIRALRGTVDDYLDMADLENELVTVLTCWRFRWSQERPEGKLVTILAPNGGAGASTIAANLAVELAKDAKTVGLVDLKLETGDLPALLDLKPTHSLADLCKNLDRLDQSFFERSLATHASGVQLLAAPKHLGDIDLITHEGIRQAIGLARAIFPFVVIDLDHSFNPAQVQLLRQSDLILMVFRPDFTSLKNQTKYLDHLDGLGISPNRIRLVVNRFGQARQVPIAKIEEALNTKVFQVIPDDSKSANWANNTGTPFTIGSPKSTIARSLCLLAENIQTTLNAEKVVEKVASTGETKTIVHSGSLNNRASRETDYRPNLANQNGSLEVSDRRSR